MGQARNSNRKKMLDLESMETFFFKIMEEHGDTAGRELPVMPSRLRVRLLVANRLQPNISILIISAKRFPGFFTRNHGAPTGPRTIFSVGKRRAPEMAGVQANTSVRR